MLQALCIPHSCICARLQCIQESLSNYKPPYGIAVVLDKGMRVHAMVEWSQGLLTLAGGAIDIMSMLRRRLWPANRLQAKFCKSGCNIAMCDYLPQFDEPHLT